MTKLIDSLCVDVPHRASKIKDSSESYREIINEAYRDMNGVSYDDAYSVYGWWCPGFDVRALGKQWPNGDPKKSEIFFVPSSNLDVVAVPETVEDHPESMMIIVKSLADSLGVPYVELYPGYYYADSAAKTVDRIGSFEDVKSWVESLESYDDSEGLFNGKDPDKVWDYLKRWNRGSVKDSLQDAKEKSSKRKVSDAAYNPKFEKIRKILSDTTIVEELSHYMASDELEEFTETLSRNYDIDLDSEVLDSSDSSRKEAAYSYLEENEDEDIEDKIESVTNILFGDTPDFFNKVNWVSSSLLPNTLDPSEYAVLHVEPEAEGKVALRLDTVYDDPKQLEWISAEVADIIGVDDSVVPKAGYFLINSDGDIKYLGYSAKDFDRWVNGESSKK